jgi:catechol-2,3-dioxygenase
MQLDHIVLWVSNLGNSVKFYSAFLGKTEFEDKESASWLAGQTKFFVGVSSKDVPMSFDKENIGLNHIAFRANSLDELKVQQSKLDEANIKHSGIQIDRYGGKEFIWFDDPDGIRLEFYLRSTST